MTWDCHNLPNVLALPMADIVVTTESHYIVTAYMMVWPIFLLLHKDQCVRGKSQPQENYLNWIHKEKMLTLHQLPGNYILVILSPNSLLQ